MLNSPAIFPEVGSWALFDREGEIVAARIVSLSPDRRVAGLSFPDRPTASGAMQVEVARLLDPTPLSDAERDEAEALSTHLAGLANPKRSPKTARYEALWLRTHRLGLLVAQLARLNRFRSLATPATREAHRIFAAALQADAERKDAA